MSKARWTTDDFKKAGLIETDKGFVPGKNLVAKGKVKKIEPGTFIGRVDPYEIEKTATQINNIKVVRKDGTIEGLDLENLNDLSLYERSGAYQMQIDEAHHRIREDITGNYFKNLKKYPSASFTPFRLPTGEFVFVKHEFDLTPFPAPRMTRSDKWKTDPNHPDPARRQRKPVARYFAWRDAFTLLCKQKGYDLQERLHVVFVMPMPKYLSRMKRETMNGQAHKQRPDVDNCLKSVADAFRIDDGFLYDVRGIKIWGEVGKILIIY